MLKTSEKSFSYSPTNIVNSQQQSLDYFNVQIDRDSLEGRSIDSWNRIPDFLNFNLLRRLGAYQLWSNLWKICFRRSECKWWKRSIVEWESHWRAKRWGCLLPEWVKERKEGKSILIVVFINLNKYVKTNKIKRKLLFFNIWGFFSMIFIVNKFSQSLFN